MALSAYSSRGLLKKNPLLGSSFATDPNRGEQRDRFMALHGEAKASGAKGRGSMVSTLSNRFQSFGGPQVSRLADLAGERKKLEDEYNTYFSADKEQSFRHRSEGYVPESYYAKYEDTESNEYASWAGIEHQEHRPPHYPANASESHYYEATAIPKAEEALASHSRDDYYWGDLNDKGQNTQKIGEKAYESDRQALEDNLASLQERQVDRVDNSLSDYAEGGDYAEEIGPDQKAKHVGANALMGNEIHQLLVGDKGRVRKANGSLSSANTKEFYDWKDNVRGGGGKHLGEKYDAWATSENKRRLKEFTRRNFSKEFNQDAEDKYYQDRKDAEKRIDETYVPLEEETLERQKNLADKMELYNMFLGA